MSQSTTMASGIPTSLSELTATLPSLSPFLAQLASVLSSSAPPETIFIHAPTNQSVILPLIQLVLDQTIRSPSNSFTRPSIQSLLPKVAVVDLTEVHSTRAAFDRALNGLSGWLTPAGLGEGWSETDRVVPNWDGRVHGCSVVRRAKRGGPVGKAPESGSGRPAKRQKRESPSKSPAKATETEVDYDLVVIPSSSQDEAAAAAGADERDGWALRWDRSAGAADKDPVGPIRDTLDYFYISLDKICKLGVDENSSREEAAARRWLIFDHAEMLHDLPAAGNAGGAPKETGLGMTFASAIYRVGQLVSWL